MMLCLSYLQYTHDKTQAICGGFVNMDFTAVDGRIQNTHQIDIQLQEIPQHSRIVFHLHKPNELNPLYCVEKEIRSGVAGAFIKPGRFLADLPA